jgi:hypothetical protein
MNGLEGKFGLTWQKILTREGKDFKAEHALPVTKARVRPFMGTEYHIFIEVDNRNQNP